MFDVDTEGADDGYLWVTVTAPDGRAVVVCIKADDDGVAVDLYPPGPLDEAQASTWLEYANEED